jgi:hypothetical protein
MEITWVFWVLAVISFVTSAIINGHPEYIFTISGFMFAIPAIIIALLKYLNTQKSHE